MRKHFVAAVAAAALLIPASSFVAVAAPQDEKAEHARFAEDHAAFVDAHIAALKAVLKLTSAQEKNWPALENAIREQAKAHAAEWREERKEHEGHHDALEALQERAKRLQERAAGLSALATAAKPLYDTLDEGQKHRFGLLLHNFAARFHHHHVGAGWGQRSHE